MQDMNAFFSIIVPVFNAEQTIERCLDSIIGQSFPNYEVIIVNDGSTDSSAIMCEKYIKLDSRFKLFNKQNGGVSSARNFGLNFVKGYYVLFLDSDDAFGLGIFERVSKNVTNYDLILFSSLTYPKFKKITFDDIVLLSGVDIGKFLFQYYIDGFSQPWAKVYRHDIIKEYKMRFDETLNLGEDTLFVNQYLERVSSINIDSFVGYIYTEGHQEHLSRKAISLELLEMSLSKILSSISFLESRFEVNLEIHQNSLILFFLHRYLKSLSNESLFDLKNKLKALCSNDLIWQAFKVNNSRSGLIQRVFNFLARNKFYFILSLYYKGVAFRFF